MAREPRMGRGKHDRLRQLRAFCQAARFQSISQAAERLDVSQPAVSRQVRTLEQELAVVLFDRKGPRISLTPAGRRLYKIAVPYVESMDRLPETFSENYRGVVGGQIEIAAGQTTAEFLLPPYLKRFRELNPDVRVNLRIASGRQRMAWLRSYEVDIAFVAMDIPPLDVESVALFVSESVLITPEDHPLAGRRDLDLREIVRYPSIAHSSGHYVRHVGEMYLSRHGLAPNVTVEVDGWGTIKSYVEAGLGISIVPDLCLMEHDRVWKFSLRQFATPRSYALVRRRDDIFSLASSAFVQVIEQCRAEEEG